MEITVNGRKTFVATGGKPFDGTKEPLVFIHGAGMDHTIWYLQVRYFSHHGYSVLAVDLPGHGRSEGGVLPSIGEMADWIIALLDALKVEKAGLVGHSMGALTALDVSGRCPNRVSRLGLLGVAATMRGNSEMIEAAKRDDHLAMDLVNSWGHGRPAHVGLHPQPGLWMTGGGIRLLERSGPGVLYNDLIACDIYNSALERGEAVACETVVVLGTLDMMTPVRNAKPLFEAIKGSHTEIIEGSGHMMMIERPGETLDALRKVF